MFHDLFIDYCEGDARILDPKDQSVVWEGKKTDCYNTCKSSSSFSSAFDLALHNNPDNPPFSSRVCFKNNGWKTRRLGVLHYPVAKGGSNTVTLPYHGYGENGEPLVNESYSVFDKDGAHLFDVILSTDIPQPEVNITDDRGFAWSDELNYIRFVSPTQIKFNINTGDKRMLYYREKPEDKWKPFLFINPGSGDDTSGWTTAYNGRVLYFPGDFSASGFNQNFNGQITILDNGTVFPGCMYEPLFGIFSGACFIVDAEYNASDDSSYGWSCDATPYYETRIGNVKSDSKDLYQECINEAAQECAKTAEGLADEECRKNTETTPCKNNGPCQENPDPFAPGDCCATPTDCSCPRSCVEGVGCSPDHGCIDSCNLKWNNYISCFDEKKKDFYNACYSEKEGICSQNFRREVTLGFKNVVCDGFATADIPEEHIIYPDNSYPSSRLLYSYRLRNGVQTLDNLNFVNIFNPGTTNYYFFTVENPAMLFSSSDESIFPLPKENMSLHMVFTYRYQLTKGSGKQLTIGYGMPVNVNENRMNVILDLDGDRAFSWEKYAQINQTYDDSKIAEIQPGGMGCFEAPFPLNWPKDESDISVDDGYIGGYIIYDKDNLMEAQRLGQSDFWKNAHTDYKESERPFAHVWTYQFFGKNAKERDRPNSYYPSSTRFVELADFDFGTTQSGIPTSPGGSVTLKNNGGSDGVGITNYITYYIDFRLYENLCNELKGKVETECGDSDSVMAFVIPPQDPDDPSKWLGPKDCIAKTGRPPGCVYAVRVKGNNEASFKGLEPSGYRVTESVSGKSIMLNSRKTDVILPLIYESWDPVKSTVLEGSEVCVRNADERERTVGVKTNCAYEQKCFLEIGDYCIIGFTTWTCSDDIDQKALGPGEVWCPVASATTSSYAFVDGLTGAQLPIEVKQTCDGSEMDALAKRLVAYDKPEEVWKSEEYEKLSDYNPHGVTTPVMVTAPVGLDTSKDWAKGCIANMIQNVKRGCPNCVTVLPVPNDITLDEQKGFIDDILGRERGYTDLIGQFAFLGERGVCDPEQLIRDKMNVSAHAARPPSRPEDARLSVILGYGVPDESIRAFGGEGCFEDVGKSEARKEAAVAFKELFEKMIPEIVGSGIMGISMHCLTDGECVPWNKDSAGKVIPLGLYESSGGKSPETEMWWDKCGEYFYAGKGVLPVLGAAEETEAATCDPSKVWALYQQYKCGVS